MPEIDCFDPKILSSAHICFLFGAGANGSMFPQMLGFPKTEKEISDATGKKCSDIESGINSIPSSEKKEEVLKVFREEFESFPKPDINSTSGKNLARLFMSVYSLIEKSENRRNTMKQVNIFTLNYDCIAESILDSLGYLFCTISMGDIEKRAKHYGLIGYDSSVGSFLPTFILSKVHGDIEKGTMPGDQKYRVALGTQGFEILFHMKEKLMRMNSVLIVIGYSGRDMDINNVISDAVVSGLTVYWFLFSESDSVPDLLKDSVYVFKHDYLRKVDCTLICSEALDQTWKTATPSEK